MNIKTITLFNTIITIITCIVICTAAGACSSEQLQTAAGINQVVHDTIAQAPAEVKAQPWYLFALLATDIVSSVLAALVAYRKQSNSK